MSAVTASITQPMAIPWINARRGAPARLSVTLERRVTLMVEDELNPVAELHARVFTVELVALMCVVTAQGRPIEQKRVRAHVSDSNVFAAAVIEQIEWACHTCQGLAVEVSHDDSSIWIPFRAGLLTLPIAVRDLVERLPFQPDDLELRRARRRLG